MKKIASLVMLIAGALLASQAGAQGAYAGIGVLSASTNNAEDFAAVYIGPGSGADGTATGLKLYAGYQWPTRFGIEAGYYDLGSYDVRTLGTKSDEFAVTAFTVSGTYALPMGPGFDLNFKLGLAFTSADYSCLSGCGFPFVNTGRSGTAGLLGIGVGWRVAPNVSLRADFESFGQIEHAVGGNIGTYDYSTLSLSAQFRF